MTISLHLAIGDGRVAQLASQLLFLGSVALYYGYLAAGIHNLRRKESAEKLRKQAQELDSCCWLTMMPPPAEMFDPPPPVAP